MRLETLTAPAAWASYLVNGDASGISAEEKAHADSWRDSNKVASVVDLACDENGEMYDQWFTKAYQAYDPLAACTGGNVLDYLCEMHAP